MQLRMVTYTDKVIQVLLQTAQLTQTTAGINFVKARVAELYKVRTSTTGLARANAAFTEIVDILNNGLGNADALTFPFLLSQLITPNAVAQLIANRTFLGAEVTAWVAQNHGGVTWTAEHPNEILLMLLMHYATISCTVEQVQVLHKQETML